MSTYDAYNLSLRDSTEFTVPTGGGSGSSGRLDIFKLNVRVSPSNNISSGAIMLACNRIQTMDNITAITGISETLSIDADNNWHEVEVVAVDGEALCVCIPLRGSSVDLTNMSDTITIFDTTNSSQTKETAFVMSGDGYIDVTLTVDDSGSSPSM